MRFYPFRDQIFLEFSTAVYAENVSYEYALPMKREFKNEENFK